MPKFSQRSKSRLESCHPLLQKLFNEVIKNVDCTIIEGLRSKKVQEEYVRTGKSKTMNSKHLKQLDGYSHAVDVMVYPIEWNNSARNYMFAGYVKGVAESLGIKIRMGADWDGDFDAKDQSFHDLPHFELVSTESSKSYLPDAPSEDDINSTLDEIEKNLGF
jgi:peptidoglycan L-alanyl-D-glutamate endopeptidase CwlK